MKSKEKTITLTILFIVLFSVVYWIYNLPKQTTYGEVMSDLLGEKIIIEIRIYDEKNGELVKITDTDTIKNITEGPSETKLEEVDYNKGLLNKYFMFMQTDDYDEYDIELSENSIDIQGYYYSTKGNNEIYQIVNETYLKHYNQKRN